jgi:hypothetical protein
MIGRCFGNEVLRQTLDYRREARHQGHAIAALVSCSGHALLLTLANLESSTRLGNYSGKLIPILTLTRDFHSG